MINHFKTSPIRVTLIFGTKPLTLAFETLSEETIEHRSTVVAERGRHVVVDFESMGNIEIEAFCQHLKRQMLMISLIIIGLSQLDFNGSPLEILLDLILLGVGSYSIYVLIILLYELCWT